MLIALLSMAPVAKAAERVGLKPVVALGFVVYALFPIVLTSGDTVTAGMQIGSVGNAGASLVPHLHFQLLSEWPSNISVIAEKDRPFYFSQYP